MSRETFDRVVCVNLDRRPERWARFQANKKAVEWPFKEVERFRAVDGNKVPTPGRWISGGGAWGCMQSHRRILEDCLLDGVKSVLVFEDDAWFPPEFAEGVRRFFERVPDDWDCVMLGGQHINIGRSPPPVANLGVVRCVNCQRTHAYGLREKAIEKLYQRWHSWTPGTTGHCDHIMGPFMGAMKTYAPADDDGTPRMLVAQDDNVSDIAAGRQIRRVFWNPPKPDSRVVLIPPSSRPDPDVLRNTDPKVHMGYWIDPITGVDNGLRTIFGVPSTPLDWRGKFEKWMETLRWESASLGAKVGVWLGPYHAEEAVKVVRDVCGGLLEEPAHG